MLSKLYNINCMCISWLCKAVRQTSDNQVICHRWIPKPCWRFKVCRNIGGCLSTAAGTRAAAATAAKKGASISLILQADSCRKLIAVTALNLPRQECGNTLHIYCTCKYCRRATQQAQEQQAACICKYCHRHKSDHHN